MEVIYTAPVAGLAIGFLVGCIGIGGGALMMPYLLFGLGLDPITAVGTDLVYAALVKAVGTVEHSRLKTIDWSRVRLLASGSLPGMALASLGFFYMASHSPQHANQRIEQLVGAAILLVACVSILKPWLVSRLGSVFKQFDEAKTSRSILVGSGFAVGTLVALTSVGSGALVALVLASTTRLEAKRIVGTDLAHGVLLISLGAVIHVVAGSVQWPIVVSIVVGGIPGVILGSRLSVGLPDSLVRAGISLALVMTGVSLV
jgi:uncharacterized membrane protein YfcA